MLSSFCEAVEPLPTKTGGRAVIAVVDSTPPAMAMLATGSVYCSGGMVRFAVEAVSSVAQARAGAATLLVAADGGALRASIAPLVTDTYEDVAVLSGPIAAIRQSVELPWSLELSFVPSGAAGADAFLAYWQACRTWLADPAAGAPPDRPHV